MIEPALSAEEWAEYNNPVVFTDQHVESGCCSCDLGDRHSLAARCLHGQEYGFTWDMLRALGDNGHYNQTAEDHELAMRALANIEALLPPEGT